MKPNAVPNYPCGLPGGLRPNLVVPLKGLLAKEDVLKFMEIERPQHDLGGRLPDDNSPTIGTFYGAILDGRDESAYRLAEVRALEEKRRRSGLDAA